MKISVLCGSPKSDDLSVTMQYVRYIQKRFPDHSLEIINISRSIRDIEKDEEKLRKIAESVKSSDGVIWAFPVYIWLVPYQYKRFIELIAEKDLAGAFKGKYAAVLSSSIHFFDNTAVDYMNAICDDLDMKYLGSFSADMYDLLRPKERERLRLFAEYLFESIKNRIPTAKRYNPVAGITVDYQPGEALNKVDASGEKIVVLTDCSDETSNLGKMVRRFRNSFSGDVEIFNINDVNIKGGCLGCLSCTVDNVCVYDESDKFSEFYKTKLKTADIIVFSGTIVDRYLSSRWKLFFDRTFFYNHVPTLVGKQIAFIVSGPLNQIPDIRHIFEAHLAIHKANVVDFVTDENRDSVTIDERLQNLAYHLMWFAGKGYKKTATFPDIAGMKIFRDNVWGRLRIVLQADHEYYKRHGFYDYPRRNIKTKITDALVIALNKIPAIRKEFSKKIAAEMVKPLKKVLNVKSL